MSLRGPDGHPSAAGSFVGSPAAAPAPCLEDRPEPTIFVKTSRPVGVLGMTDGERAELKRTKKWPTRQVEAPEGPPGLSLTSLPSREYLRGFSDALPRPRRGRRSTRDNELLKVAECLKEKSQRASEACDLYVDRSPTVDKATARRQFWRGLKTLQTLWDGD